MTLFIRNRPKWCEPVGCGRRSSAHRLETLRSPAANSIRMFRRVLSERSRKSAVSWSKSCSDATGPCLGMAKSPCGNIYSPIPRDRGTICQPRHAVKTSGPEFCKVYEGSECGTPEFTCATAKYKLDDAESGPRIPFS